MIIYDANGSKIADIDVTDESYRYRKIQGDNSITLHFSSFSVSTDRDFSFIDIPIGSYVDFLGERYTLNKPENFTKNHTRDYEYTLILDGAQSVLGKYKLRNTVDHRLKFTQTARPAEFVQMIVDNLNQPQRDSGWTVGTCLDSTEKTLSFNHNFLTDALQMIAEAFNTEWEITAQKVINLKKVEYNKSAPLSLSYGKGNGFRPGLGRSNFDNSKAIEILYIQGGEKNIDRDKYPSPTLLLPIAKTIYYDGTSFYYTPTPGARGYVSSGDGCSIQRSDKALATHEEDSLDCSDIYPSRVGTVSAVNVVDASRNLYDIIDQSIPVDLDFNSYLIAGEKMTLIFQSGELAGREFDVNYIAADKRFELVPAQLDGVNMPGGDNGATFIPAVNDTYAIFGISLPTQYVCNDTAHEGASWDMFREAVKYLFENEDPRFSFTGELDPIWARKNWLNIGSKIVLGGYINYSDDQFLPNGALIRIVGIKDFINNQYATQIELSNVTTGGTVSSELNKRATDEVLLQTTIKETINYTKRGFKAAKETADMLQKAIDTFSPAINPATVQTMSLLVGDESLQFRFVNSKTTPASIPDGISYNNTTKTLTCPSGIIQHMILGLNSISNAHPASEYKFWDLGLYTSPYLADTTKGYYLYAKVSATDQTGTFLLSDTAYKLTATTGFYYLLVGILTSEYNGLRTFTTVYGYSEVLPGRVTTDKIISSDGKTYIDLVNSLIVGDFTFKSGDSVQTLIGNAQTSANTGIANAATAQAAANAANSLLADIASDNKISPSEKQATLKEWQIIQGEYNPLLSEAANVEMDSGFDEWEDYSNAYNALNAYLSPLLSNLTITSVIVGADFRTYFANYYNAKIVLLNEISSLINNTANTGIANAATAQAAANAAQNYINNVLPSTISGLQSQIDGQIISWFYQVDPTLTNAPASEWTTDVLKLQHANDTYTNTNTGGCWRWQQVSGVWGWGVIADTATQQALAAAGKAQDTADGKRRVFTTTPTTPYDIGDLWAQGADGNLMACFVSKGVGTSYVATDWGLATKYTDDTAANAAALAASNAQTAANTGIASAATANNLLADIANDNKLTPSEKTTTQKEWNIIVSEVTKNDSQADVFGVSRTTYDNAYSALNTYITPLLSSLATTSDITGTTFRGNFKAYYDARTDLLNSIATKAKELADAAQTSANTGIANAATAQAAADAAATAASNANNAIQKITSDNVLSAVEKSGERLRWDEIYNEKSSIDSQATTFGITTEKTNYDNTFQSLANYLNNGAIWSSGVPSWLSDANLGIDTTITGSVYRSTWAAFLSAKVTLLNKISAVAKSSGDTAQTNLNNLQIGGVNILDGTKIINQNLLNINGNIINNDYLEFSSISNSYPSSSYIDVLSKNNISNLKVGIYYTVSFYAKSTVNGDKMTSYFYPNFNGSDSDGTTNTTLTTSWARYSISWLRQTNDAVNLIICRLISGSGSGTVSICGVKFEEGNKATAWSPSVNDVQGQIDAATTAAATAQAAANALNYLKAAMQSTTDVNGGLLTTELLRMKDNSDNINGGLSGVQNDNIGFWTGGTYEQALSNLAKIILRKDGSGQLAGGAIHWDTGNEISIKVKKLIYSYLISDDVIVNNPDEMNSSSTAYTKLLVIKLGDDVGINVTLRIKFNMLSEQSNGATDIVYGKVYRNGSPIGTERQTSSDFYVTFSEDITNWNAGDTIELWAKVTSGINGISVTVKNLQICGTHIQTVDEVTGTNYRPN